MTTRPVSMQVRPPPPQDEQGDPPQLEITIGTRADLSSVKVTTVAPTAKMLGSVSINKVEKNPDFSVVYGAQPVAEGTIKFKIRIALMMMIIMFSHWCKMESNS